MEVCKQMGIETREEEVTRPELEGMEGVFLTSSARGVVEVASVDGKEIGRSEAAGRIANSIFDL